MPGDKTIEVDFSQSGKGKDPVMELTDEVLGALGTCSACTYFVRGENGGSCHGLPAQVILVPNARKSKVLVPGEPPPPPFDIKQVYPGRYAQEKPCALFDPAGMSAQMIDLTKRYTFFPETLSDEDLEFIKEFRRQNKL